MLELLESSFDHSVKLNEIRKSAGKIKALSYLIGVYLGDGCIMYYPKKKYYRFRLNTIDKDFAEATIEAINVLTGRQYKISCHPVKKSNNLNYAVSALCDFYWIKYLCENKNKIPDFIWDSNKECKLELIAGIMDSEGYCSNGTKGRKSLGLKATDKWIMDFYKLMINIGVITGKQGLELLPSGKTSIRYHFNIKSFYDCGCYFKIYRKQKRINEWLLNPQRLHVKQLLAEDIVRTYMKV